MRAPANRLILKIFPHARLPRKTDSIPKTVASASVLLKPGRARYFFAPIKAGFSRVAMVAKPFQGLGTLIFQKGLSWLAPQWRLNPLRPLAIGLAALAWPVAAVVPEIFQWLGENRQAVGALLSSVALGMVDGKRRRGSEGVNVALDVKKISDDSTFQGLRADFLKDPNSVDTSVLADYLNAKGAVQGETIATSRAHMEAVQTHEELAAQLKSLRGQDKNPGGHSKLEELENTCKRAAAQRRKLALSLSKLKKGMEEKLRVECDDPSLKLSWRDDGSVFGTKISNPAAFKKLFDSETILFLRELSIDLTEHKEATYTALARKSDSDPTVQMKTLVNIMGQEISGESEFLLAWRKSFRELFGSPHLQQLTHLKLSRAHLRVEEIRALFKSARLQNLTSLDLSRNDFYRPSGDEPSHEATAAREASEIIQLIAGSTLLSNLSRLELEGNQLADAVSILADSPALGNLQYLGLRDTCLDLAQVQALAESSRLQKLEELDFGFNDLPDEEVVSIMRASRQRHLKSLKKILLDSVAVKFVKNRLAYQVLPSRR